MSGPVLQNAAIDMVGLRERVRQELTVCIDKVRGPKALVLDPSLSGPLGLIAEKQLLKEHGVEKSYHLRHEPIETDQRRVIFFVRDKLPNMKAIASQIKHHQANRQKLEYLVVMVPRRTIICERVLEEEGVYSDVQIVEFELDLIPCEEDVLSMEIPEGFRECHLDGDKSSLFYAAKGLMRLQSMFGLIPTIKGKGANAKAVADMMLKLRRENWEDQDGMESEIDELILVDRETDMVTPMLTQLTYEGLIDDTFSINNGIVELPAHLISSAGAAPTPAQGGKNKIKVQFNSSDQLFAELRDANFEQVGSIVKKRATFLKSVQDEKDDLQGKSVMEIKEYVKKLKEINIQQEKNLLSLHTSIALEIKALVTQNSFSNRLELEQGLLQGRIGVEKALETIQDFMYRGEHFLKVLRCLCLVSLINNGIRKYDAIKTELAQVYGFEAMLVAKNLEKLGLLKKSDTPSGIAAAAGLSVTAAGISVAANLTNKIAATTGWEAVKKRLQLVVDGADEKTEQDVAYVYSGYAPITIRLVERALFPPQPGWMSLEETLKPLPGPLFEVTQEPANARSAWETQPSERPSKTRHVALIFFIGGVTCAEISAVRFLGRQDSAGRRRGDNMTRQYIVGTTKLISGDSILSSFVDPLANTYRTSKLNLNRKVLQ